MGNKLEKDDYTNVEQPGTRETGHQQRFSEVFNNVQGSESCNSETFLNKIFYGRNATYINLLYATAVKGTNNKESFMSEDQYCKLGLQLLELTDRNQQLQWYFNLFTNNKGQITQDEVLQMLQTVCIVSYEHVGIDVSSDVKEDDPVFKAILTSLFNKDKETVEWSHFKYWSGVSFPGLYTTLHAYTLHALLGNRSSEVQGASGGSESELVSSIRSGTSVMSWSMMWSLCCSLPLGYFSSSNAASSIWSQLSAPDLPMEVAVHPQGWHQLYSSNRHGLSVTRFQTHVFDYKGQSVMLLKFQDTVYCLALDDEWRETTQRLGGVESCLFQILPQYKHMQGGAPMVYLNFSNRTMPQNLSVGKTPATTFLKVDSEMSKVNHYGVDFPLTAVEVWGCANKSVLAAQRKQQNWHEKEAEKNKNRKLKIGIEDWKDSPDRQILAMGGVKTEHAER